MRYHEALEFLESSVAQKGLPGLERMKKLLSLMGNPEKELACIHVAGTNGKGSTGAMLSSTLIAAGYKSGFFTSPCLEVRNDQIRINCEYMTNEAFARSCAAVKEAADQMTECNQFTEFELMTAIALHYFKSNGCDFAILETGLGGTLDATNVIGVPKVAILTNIGMDHMQHLGNTLLEIAASKAGIIKEGGCVVSYEQLPEVKEVIDAAADKQKASVIYADFSKITVHGESLSMQKMSYKDYDISIPLIGEHQRRNAAVALEAVNALIAQGYSIPKEAVERGMFQVNWPARFEILAKRPLVILDGGHNIQCIQEAKKVLNQYVPDRKIIFVFGVMADKDYKAMIRELIPIAKEFIAVTPRNPRALPARDLAMAIHDQDGIAEYEDSVEDGIMAALEKAEVSDVICIIGSLYMAGDVRNCFSF